MASVIRLTFNPFQENTYIVYDASGECIIFDPGCHDQSEKEELSRVIEERNLRPVRLINTHCHLDHVFGNRYVADTYGLSLEIHPLEQAVLDAVPQVCMLYGLPPAEPSPTPARYIEAGETLFFGESRLQTLLCPGHSPGSLCFYEQQEGFIIAGDVLFYGSIGRTDLPGGNHDALIASIRRELMPLPDPVRVYPGHGPATTIGFERMNNPFL
jgi:hydroxyacylglutathione hydrolase